MDLIDFREAYEAAGDFAYLKNAHTSYVSGRGSERPTVMLLGDAPSAVENNERKSLVGQPGRVLDQLMGVAGLYAEDQPPEDDGQYPSMDLGRLANAYVTSFVKYRPGARALLAPEIDKSLPWVRLEWKALRRPPVIVTLGVSPTRCLLGMGRRLSELVGNPQPIAAGGPTIWPMLHPSYALNNPQIRPVCEEHWHALGAWLKEEGLV